MIIQTLLLLACIPHESRETRIENAIVERAMQCDRLRHTPHPEFLHGLLYMEKAVGVPDELRGLTLAAACHESGFNPHAKGDRKFSKRGKPKAIGMFQQWPWVERYYGIDRSSAKEATWAWLAHWHRALRKVKRDCGFKTPYRQWVAAQVTAIRAPTKDRKARCGERSKHFHRWKRWRRSWKHLESDG